MKFSMPAKLSIPASVPAARLDTVTTNKVLRNTYMLLSLSMIPTILGTVVGVYFPIMAHMGWMSLILFLGAVFGLQAMIIKNKHRASGIGWLLLFTFVMGIFMGPLVGLTLGSFSNGALLVSMAAGGTAAIFFVIAGYASVTKRNFSDISLGRTLTIGMLMLLVISIVNGYFIQMPTIALAISSLVIVVASGSILFIVNRVVRGGEDNYIMVTLTIYIMLLNIFQSLLHLLMVFAGNRE